MAEVIRPFNARMSVGLKPTVKHLYTDGNTVIVHFDASSVATDGIPYKNEYVWILKFEGNQVIDAVAFFDSIAFNDLWKRVKPKSQ